MHFKWQNPALTGIAGKPLALSSDRRSEGFLRRKALTKTLLIMKLTVLLLLTACLQVSAKSYAQQVSLSLKDAPLEKVFKEIQKQTGYQFVYNNRLVRGSRNVSLQVSKVSVEQVLQLCFKDQPLTYAIIDKTIIVKPKEVRSFTAASAPVLIAIRGTVQDEEGNPLMGVSITIKGSDKGVTTSANGEFSIPEADENATLVFSSVGYEAQTIPVQKRTSFFVRLKRSTKALDEMYIIGYGTTTKRYSTGSVTRITSDDISKQPVTNVLLAMQGRMPGVYVAQNNGLPGAGLTIQIRGANSLNRTPGQLPYTINQPLYIIDGVPYLSEPINTQSTTSNVLPSAEGNTHPMNTINPADIESIDILKDADATAIYGSRGANGVVLITTKRGKAGRTQFTMNVNTGQSKVANFVELLGTPEYIALRKKGFANYGNTPTVANAPDLLVWDTTAYTDFQKVLIGGTAHSTDVTASVSGGDTRTNFLLSGSYHHETNVYPGGQGYRRAAANISINHSSADKKLSIGFTAIYSADKNNITATDLTTYAYNLSPNFPLYKADGSLYWTGDLLGTKNPLGYLYQTNDNKTSNLMSSLNLKYNLIKGLDIKTTMGFSRTDMDQVRITPSISMDPGVASNVPGSMFSYNYTNNYIIEPQATYKATIWKGTLEALAGGTWQFRQSKQPFYTIASGFASDEFLRNPSLATTISTRTSSQDYKYASFFGRLNYNWDGRYIANLVYRRDGSSRFGPGNKYGNFGSAGAAWIFSEEQFVKGLHWLSFGKLRGSYGVIGSDAIGNYGYLDSYSSYSYAYNGMAGLYPSRLANADYKWEETRKLEAAIELGFLNDRLLLTAAFYRNRTSNQLINFTVSPQTGFTTYQSNLPALVENKGWEFSLSSTNIRNKDFTWSTSLNVSLNRNKLLKFDNIEKTSYFGQYIVGNPISSVYVYHYKGIDTLTGLPSFEDANKSGTITGGFAATGRGDRYFAGTTYPEYFGGLSNTFKYKGLSLDILFQFVKQKARSIMSASFYPPGYMYNASAEVVHEYLALGSRDKLITATTSPSSALAAYLAYSNYTGSDALLVDASFIRLKNVSLSYSLPEKLLRKARLNNLRLYVQGQNLFTITSYDGFDPESQSVSVPPLRTIVTGIQFTF
ncbi:TonB-dependent receptor [Pseudoflavitalea sp. X16]|uniref:TonB-dependent receptor n=1 Tax=Paraflavitalea devenefica TaxID=2716334 RepID=UPI00141E800F|nr:TonB-dependent receptor [Paraflavitalea devenefica]NII28484.1 TonB-dependent receptor [Paraflavitalea devenefica]